MNIVEDDNNGGQQQQAGIPAAMLKDADDVKCEKCEGLVFEEKMIIKKVSKFMTGSDRDTVTPVPVIVCASCNNINDMFKPKF